MPHPVYTPCVNSNDDVVRLINIEVKSGDAVKAGELIAEVETDKAIVEVEAERDGYVLGILFDEDDSVRVGSILMWIGDSPDEVIPELPSQQPKDTSALERAAKPTAKARALLAKHNLTAEQISYQGDRLTTGDIEAFIAQKRNGAQKLEAREADLPPTAAAEAMPNVPGTLHVLNPEEHGMLSTVTWHRDHAVATYLEMEYDPQPWEEYAAAYATQHKFMLSPLLSLMAYRLVDIARNTPKINCTLVNGQKYRYDQVNLGFTVQVGETLYLTVVQQADAMETRKFIDVLGEIQRHAMAKKLRADELQGATLSFSSMARWKVSRHVPILAPYTAIMVAHSAPNREGGPAVLGACYDHRVLSGFDVARVLQELTQPPTLA